MKNDLFKMALFLHLALIVCLFGNYVHRFLPFVHRFTNILKCVDTKATFKVSLEIR